MIRPESLEKAYEIAAEFEYDIRGLDMSFKERAVEIRRVSKIDEDGEVLPLDFLLVTPQVEDVWETKEKLIWQNKTLWIVSREGLIKMKKLAGREKDLIDIDRLKMKKVDMSSEAITRRLRQVDQLRELSLSLMKAKKFRMKRKKMVRQSKKKRRNKFEIK